MGNSKAYFLQNSDLIQQGGDVKSLFLQFNENLAFNFEFKKGIPAEVLFSEWVAFLKHMDQTMYPEKYAPIEDTEGEE